MNSIFKWLQGRHTAFAALELLLGTGLAWFGKLDMTFVSLVTVIQGMVLAHSIKEDHYAQATQVSDASKS